ncbi:MAG TPA: (Fe-S)-binding protein [Chloroflexi bacterium]|nr:(Fe-S)-binding protein [Chloroflexota bacterium]
MKPLGIVAKRLREILMGSEALDATTFDPSLAERVTPDWDKLFSCMQCGTCTSSCPTAYAMDYSPRQLWQMLRLGLEEAVFNSQTFWLCTACKSCQVRCPRGISLTDTMIALKAYATQHGSNVPTGMQMLEETVATKHNISGDENMTRRIWSENLPHKPMGVRPRRRQADVVYFIGCVGSFYPRVYGIPQAAVQILERAEVNFTVLGEDEWCCGYPLYVAGMGDRLLELVRHNVRQVRRVGARRVIFSCPSCYYAWSHLYPEVVDASDIQLQHVTEYLVGMLPSGNLKLGPVEEVVTYHDPCDLGRKSGVFDAPRELLNLIPGLTFKEVVANRENALCCGGGGDVEISDASVSQAVAGRRMRQIEATGARYVASACQQCKRTLQEGARRHKIRVRAVDVVELLWQSMQAGADE